MQLNLPKTLDTIIQKLDQELSHQNRKEIVSLYEDILFSNVPELVHTESFYYFPLDYIFGVIQKLDFLKFEKPIDIIRSLIEGTTKAHSKDINTLLLLGKINCQGLSELTIDDCVNFLSYFTQSSICLMLSELYDDDNIALVPDYLYEIETLKQQIETLKSSQKTDQNTFQLEKPDDFEPNIHSFDNDMPLINIASIAGSLSVVQYFIETLNVDPNQEQKSGNNVLHVACMNNRLEIVKYLLSRNSNLNSKGYQNRTCIHFCVLTKSNDVLKYLIEEKNADINAQDLSRQTPLHLAALTNQLEIVSYLLSHGAKPGLTDNYGKKAIDLTNDEQIKTILANSEN